ncbi:MAG: hypothetical protein U1E10_01800 [Bdellovibrionales bacterium]|nr:hypothetical protein [Bdellovibrionales bacterium]
MRNLFLFAALILGFGSTATAAIEPQFCCIQSTLDNEAGIDHSGKSAVCVSNNAQEIPEVSSGVFSIEKHGHVFTIDLNKPRTQSIAITKPDGKVQTGPEREIIKGLAYDLFIGTFGSPVYQYSTETHGGFKLDCHPK